MKEVWIGLIRVSPTSNQDVLQGSPGAYVNVLTVADCADEYLYRVAEECRTHGLTLEELLWCCSLATRLLHYDIENYLKEVAIDVGQTGKTLFGVFHGWEEEGDDDNSHDS